MVEYHPDEMEVIGSNPIMDTNNVVKANLVEAFGWSPKGVGVRFSLTTQNKDSCPIDKVIGCNPIYKSLILLLSSN